MIDRAAGFADGVDEGEHGAARCGQVLDDQHPRALRQFALDLRVAAMTLGLLAHIDHRQAEPLGQKGGKGNACDAIELLETCLGQDGRRSKIHHGGADARIGDELSAIDVDRAHHAGRELVGLGGVEMHRLDFQKLAGDEFGDLRLVRKCVGKHRRRSRIKRSGQFR